MDKELSKKLFNRFKFFKPQKPIVESLMGFGFECGSGWFDLIWGLCEGIEKELGKQKHDFVEEAKERLGDEYYEFEVIQVKEKFGTLRFYTNWGTEEIYKLINEAEEKSATICEVCGSPGKIRNDGWISVLCDKHYEEEKNGRN